MTSAFFFNASSVTMEHINSIAQTTTQAGVRQAQRRSPIFYRFTVNYPIVYINSTEHTNIKNAIIISEYGLKTFKSNIPSKWGITKRIGTFNFNENTPPRPKDNSQSGYTIAVDNYTADQGKLAQVGDFFQFYKPNTTKTWSKVMQVTENVSTGVGETTDINFTFNISIPTLTIDTGFRIRTGEDVVFNLMIEQLPEPNFINGSLVQFSNGVFREVLERI